MLRPQGMYPLSGGVPPMVLRPVIVLIVRHEKRGLGNSDEVGHTSTGQGRGCVSRAIRRLDEDVEYCFVLQD